MSNIADTMNPKVEWLSVIGDAATWQSLGLTVTADGFVPLLGTSIRLVAPDPGRFDHEDLDHEGLDLVDAGAAAEGIAGWALSGVSAPNSEAPLRPTTPPAAPGPTMVIDGLATDVVDPIEPVFAVHALGASSLDHVVVLTSDLMRTSDAVVGATGCELKRVREVGPMRQGFHRIGRGGLIVELVERPEVSSGLASFWGLVLIVDDLDAACRLIGPERISPPKDAVQPGRRIATVRSDVGVGMPLALMTP